MHKYLQHLPRVVNEVSELVAVLVLVGVVGEVMDVVGEGVVGSKTLAGRLTRWPGPSFSSPRK